MVTKWGSGTAGKRDRREPTRGDRRGRTKKLKLHAAAASCHQRPMAAGKLWLDPGTITSHRSGILQCKTGHDSQLEPLLKAFLSYAVRRGRTPDSAF